MLVLHCEREGLVTVYGELCQQNAIVSCYYFDKFVRARGISLILYRSLFDLSSVLMETT